MVAKDRWRRKEEEEEKAAAALGRKAPDQMIIVIRGGETAMGTWEKKGKESSCSHFVNLIVGQLCSLFPPFDQPPSPHPPLIIILLQYVSVKVCPAHWVVISTVSSLEPLLAKGILEWEISNKGKIEQNYFYCSWDGQRI